MEARVATKLGPGRVTAIRNARDRVAGHGHIIRGVAWVTVELDSGGPHIFPAREVEALEKDRGGP